MGAGLGGWATLLGCPMQLLSRLPTTPCSPGHGDVVQRGDVEAGIAMATRSREVVRGMEVFLGRSSSGRAQGAPPLWGEVMNEPCYGEDVGHETLPCSQCARGSLFAPDSTFNVDVKSLICRSMGKVKVNKYLKIIEPPVNRKPRSCKHNILDT